MPSNLAGHIVTRIPTSRHVVALTFDGGAGSQALRPILDTLAREGVHATFFLTGDFARLRPDLVRAIAAAGHVVGDHTLTHPHLTTLTADGIRAQVASADAIVRPLIGHTTRPWFRFPYGEYDRRSLSVVNGLGFAAIGWTVDTLGWKGRVAGSASDVVNRVMKAAQPGEIVLMHIGANPQDGTTYDADALPLVISRLRAAGYSFSTMQSLLAEVALARVGASFSL